MGKSLVLAEKPSVGREIARVLGCKQNGNGYLIGSRYIVTWALGHLVTLADPEHYGDIYKSWRLETLPMLPKKMDLVVIKETAKQYNTVKTLLQSKEISEVIIATDAGREGELVARWILEKAGIRKPLKRLWISSQTDRAIKEGFANLKDGSQYMNLYASAQSRAEADWLVGMNVTRALTCKYNAQLSAGRVQTPTLAMIVAREEEIRHFKPKEYYTVEARIKGFTALWKDRKTGQSRLFDKTLADNLSQKAGKAQFVISNLKKEHKRELPPLLYDLTELQRDANRRFGFSAKKTLNIMQQLYEKHKLLTYPRTDSRYITDDIVPTLAERLKSVAIGSYAPYAKEIIRTHASIAKRCVDNSKVSDHHAIIPTEQFVNLSGLTGEEKNIYDLVVKRFLSVFYGDFEYEELSVELDSGGELFTAKGKAVISKGWKRLYDREDESTEDYEEKAQELPSLKKGDSFKADKVIVKAGKTKPPARYTEATLLSAMEHPGKFISNAALRDMMNQTSGLGTPATRAEIIERLLSAFYVERNGNDLVPTSKGIQLISLVPEDLKQPELTAKWEEKLTGISKGSVKRDVFISDIRAYSSKLVGNVAAASGQYHHDNMTRTPCPNCGKMLLEVNGKKGKLLVCQDRECGYRKSVSHYTNARCPECHKKLELFGEGEKKIYTCSCGFREKFEVFNKRYEDSHDGISKRDVAKYMQNQERKDTGNNAMRAAFEAAMKTSSEK
ncbi:MAG: DNA topoisomerase III [Bacillota bacterium]|nr:DNA topoisomerase III [Bacillota bacterium]